MRILLGGLSDCEELVGVTKHNFFTGDDGAGVRVSFLVQLLDPPFSTTNYHNPNLVLQGTAFFGPGA